MGKVKVRVQKEPGLLRQIIETWVELGKVHKARRLLAAQEWSIDFLVMLLKKSAQYSSQGLMFVLKNRWGQELHIVKEQGVVQDFMQQEVQALDRMDAARVKTVLDQMYKQGMV